MSNKGLLYWNIVLSVVLLVMALAYIGLLFLTDEHRDATKEDLIHFEKFYEAKYHDVKQMIRDRDEARVDMAESIEELQKEVEALKQMGER